MESSSSFCFEVESETMELKAIFLPFISKSHLLFVVDMARLFAMHNVDVTIITTLANATLFQTSVDRDSSRGRAIRTHLVNFPQIPGLPNGLEMVDADSPDQDYQGLLLQALLLLKENFQQLIRDMKPDFIVTDMFYPWSADIAEELGIPRLNCTGGSYFSHAARNSIQQFAPHVNVGSDHETFLLPGLPHKVEMTRSQLSDWVKEPNDFGYVMKMIKDADTKSYGSLFRSFYELEGTYEEHYQKVTGTRSWSLGPVSIWVNQDEFDKANRGSATKEKEEENGHGVLKWLDSKEDNSVIYVSFGSMNKFPISQHIEIAHALEDSGYDFIWVVRKTTEEEGEEYGTILEEFEKRVKESNKGYLIWGWAPQLVILEHSAVGAVVTHCGWNTTLESVYAGLPMVTWPLFAEQFYNEKLLVDVLKIGVPVGAKEWKNWNEYGNKDKVVKRDDIGKAIALLMGGGEECLEIRKRVSELSDAAKKTIKVGGSSHTNLKQLLQELKSFKHQKANHEMEGEV